MNKNTMRLIDYCTQYVFPSVPEDVEKEELEWVEGTSIGQEFTLRHKIAMIGQSHTYQEALTIAKEIARIAGGTSEEHRLLRAVSFYLLV